MDENEDELKSLLMKVKEESEKAGLNCIIQKTKILTSAPRSCGRFPHCRRCRMGEMVWHAPCRARFGAGGGVRPAGGQSGADSHSPLGGEPRLLSYGRPTRFPAFGRSRRSGYDPFDR